MSRSRLLRLLNLFLLSAQLPAPTFGAMFSLCLLRKWQINQILSDTVENEKMIWFTSAGGFIFTKTVADNKIFE